MSSSIEEIYQKLLEQGFSEKELEKEIHKKAKEYGGFMSKQGILFIIAKEYGMNIYSPEIETELYQEGEEDINYDEFTLPISNLKEGMENIVLLGKILKCFSPKEFLRKDNTIGAVSSCIIGDNSGEIKVIMWDEKATVMNNDSFKEGELVRVLGDYTKINRDRNLEVHLGKKGKMILAPEDINSKVKKKLEKITYKKKEFNNHFSINSLINKYSFIQKLKGQVHIKEFKEISKKDGEKMFLLKIILTDDSGSVCVNIWGMNAIETLKLIEEGDHILVKNLSVKFNSYTSEKELSFTKNSTLEVVSF
ncbi:MAG: hypothetical protein ACXACC_00025 [Promethearchaeota archaeon]|jgi:replication factor A1